eukprot:5793265-Pyramimonas_sp.AAC.1
MAAGGSSTAALRGAAGARAAADRLVARPQMQLGDADRKRKEAKEALQVIVGDAEVAARVRCLLPALAALVAGRAPTWLQRLRRNAGLHAATPGAQLVFVDATAPRVAQRGPRLDGAAASKQVTAMTHDADAVECIVEIC